MTPFLILMLRDGVSCFFLSFAGLNMNEDGKIKEGQIISGPLFNEPMRVETGRASAEIADKVAQYYLSVDALTHLMHVCEGQVPYGERKG
jgi:hypothetical protein